MIEIVEIEIVEDVLADIARSEKSYLTADELRSYRDRIERAMAASAVPVAPSFDREHAADIVSRLVNGHTSAWIAGEHVSTAQMRDTRQYCKQAMVEAANFLEQLISATPAVPVESQVMCGESLTRQNENSVMTALADFIAESSTPDDPRLEVAYAIARHLDLNWTSAKAPKMVPEWTDEQCIQFACTAFRHAPKNLPKGVTLQDIRMGAYRVMNATTPEESP